MDEVVYNEDNDFDATTEANSGLKPATFVEQLGLTRIKIPNSRPLPTGLSSLSNDLSFGSGIYYVEASPNSVSSYNLNTSQSNDSSPVRISQNNNHKTNNNNEDDPLNIDNNNNNYNNKRRNKPLKDKKAVSFSGVGYLHAMSMSDDNYFQDGKAHELDKLQTSRWDFTGRISTNTMNSTDALDDSATITHDASRSAAMGTSSGGSRISKTPRKKDFFTSAQSYQSLLTDTSTIAPSKVRYSKALQKHRSTEKMIHPIEKHGMNLLPLKKIQLAPSKSFVNQFDYVIVFPYSEHEEKGQSADAKYIMHSILLAGLELYPYLSLNGKELFVLIRCPRGVLELLAEKSEILFPANATVLKELLARGDPENKIAPIKIRHEPNITPIEPYDYIYLKYKATVDQRLYQTSSVEDGHLFPKYLRLKLIHFLLTAPRRLGGCNLEISRLLLRKKILSIFPLHDSDICQDILQRCMEWNTMPWDVPIEDLRQYLGEKISLYMVFLSHLSKWLVPIGVLGVAAQIVVWVTGNYSHPVAPIFTVVLIMWSIIMLGFWKREQSYTAMKWGMTQFVNTQHERPEFIGELQLNSFINGKEMLYFPRHDFRSRILLSLTAILAFILLVIGVITGIYLLRFFIQSSLGNIVTVIAAILNVIEILSLNFIYQIIAVKLTNQENHRTDTEYEDALIVKVFVCQFINSYASLFFLAFIAAYLPSNNSSESNSGDERGQCGDINCMRPLALSLGLILAARMVFKNAMDLFLPYLNYLHFLRKKSRYLKDNKVDKLLTPPEMDYLLVEYDTILENVRKYSDTTVQYGYTVLFVACLPIAPLLTVFYNYLKVKFQSWKLLMLFQRPSPTGAQSIESWQIIFTLLSVFAVITNAGIISFTMDVLSGYSYSFRVWVFIGFQWLMLCILYGTAIMIPDEPETVQIQKARINYISDKVISKFPDEDYDEMIYASDDDEEEDYLCPMELSRSGSVEGAVSPLDISQSHSRSKSRSFIIKSKRLDNRSASLLSLNSATPTSPGGKRKTGKMYLKRLPYGFYQQAEVLSPCTKLYRDILDFFYPIDDTTRAEMIARSGTAQEESTPQSPDLKGTVASTTQTSNKRVYRQRLRFNDESVSSKLNALDVMEYPRTEDLQQWQHPISKDVIEYEPDLDFYKLDF